MQIDPLMADGDVLQEALLCVLHADVISAHQKRGALAQLTALKESLACPPNACGACSRRSGCEARVVDIMGAA